jgi:4-hydroxy-tetrahydrodipicolinate synthase
MIRAFVDGKPGAALELHQRLLPLFRQIFCTTSPIPAKAALQKLGLDCGACRLPLSGEDLQPAQLDELLRIVRELGALAADFAGLGKKQPALASTTA